MKQRREAILEGARAAAKLHRELEIQRVVEAAAVDVRAAITAVRRTGHRTGRRLTWCRPMWVARGDDHFPVQSAATLVLRAHRHKPIPSSSLIAARERSLDLALLYARLTSYVAKSVAGIVSKEDADLVEISFKKVLNAALKGGPR